MSRGRRAGLRGGVVAFSLGLLTGLSGTGATPLPHPAYELTLVAGQTSAAGGFNFNGYSGGEMILTVPVGWRVVVTFVNASVVPHSAEVVPYAAQQPDAARRPAFPGAATPSLDTGLPRGARATFSFVATRAGTYEFVCGVPGHAVAGMWDLLIVSRAATAPHVEVRPVRREGGPAGPQPGEASGLPGNILIADAGNNRLIEVTPDKRIVWEFPRPGDLAPGQSFLDPDDAFYTPGGRTIITNEEDNHTIALIDYATHRIVWQYGHPGHPGSAPGYLNTPDDAYQLPQGRIVVADIKNCRILVLDPPPAHHIHRELGIAGRCRAEPGFFLYPNGDTPLPNGHLLVTEIGTRSAAEVDPETGQVLYRVPLPVRYPSDTQMTRAGHYLVVDYSRPGKVVVVTRAGKVLWSYGPAQGPGRLDHPSLALELPDGDFLLNDDYNHRVIVLGRGGRIRWQYGVTGVPGRAPGYLRLPDGVDLKPPTFGRP